MEVDRSLIDGSPPLTAARVLLQRVTPSRLLLLQGQVMVRQDSNGHVLVTKERCKQMDARILEKCEEVMGKFQR